MLARTIAISAGLLATSAATAQTWNFDFGFQPTDRNGDFFTAGWNNIDYFTSFYAGLIDSEGNSYAEMALQWEGFYDSGSNTLGSENPSGDAADFPITATDDFMFGHDDGWAGREGEDFVTITLFGLDASGNTSYDFGFFGSRGPVGDIRSALFNVTGANTGSTVNNSSNNDTDVSTVNGIFADANGNITITIEKDVTNDNGSGFFYLNVITVTATVIPAPGSAAVLACGGLLAARRRR